MIDKEQYRWQTAAMVLQGLIETENSWTKRFADDVSLKYITKHAVSLTDHLINALENGKEEERNNPRD